MTHRFFPPLGGFCRLELLEAIGLMAELAVLEQVESENVPAPIRINAAKGSPPAAGFSADADDVIGYEGRSPALGGNAAPVPIVPRPRFLV
jgi:hypothetical protein